MASLLDFRTSLLDFPSPTDLDPVLACLRSIIRNFVHRNIEEEDDVVSNFFQEELSGESNVGLLAPLLPCSSSAVSGSLLSLQVDLASSFNPREIRGLIPITAERNVRVLPRLKSLTWTVENKAEIPTNRVAIITLKLQDYTKSPLNEMEVKFQLTQDTLEAVLRSMNNYHDLKPIMFQCEASLIPLHAAPGH